MSNYTLRGSEELDARIDADLEVITRTVAPHCDAGILLGGYGRGEGTPFILPDGTQAPFNDYDLVVILDTVNPTVRIQCKALEKELTQQLGITVDLCPYARDALPSCEFSLLNYEMKYGHIALWGDEHILKALPNYSPNAIPPFEGTRLLMNRGKLLLDIKRRLAQNQPLSASERICFIKFIAKVHLAFGDAALLIAGQYHILYQIKKQRIARIGPTPDRDYVMASYLSAIELKEWGDYQARAHENIGLQLAKTIEVFRRFLPWYQMQYKRRECSIPKALVLNLKWNKCINTHHPREAIYHALGDLLHDQSSMSHERFYQLQRRFS
ncbi:MAG: hypothetical protein V5783_01475 [Pontiella sp.]